MPLAGDRGGRGGCAVPSRPPPFVPAPPGGSVLIPRSAGTPNGVGLRGRGVRTSPLHSAAGSHPRHLPRRTPLPPHPLPPAAPVLRGGARRGSCTAFPPSCSGLGPAASGSRKLLHADPASSPWGRVSPSPGAVRASPEPPRELLLQQWNRCPRDTRGRSEPGRTGPVGAGRAPLWQAGTSEQNGPRDGNSTGAPPLPEPKEAPIPLTGSRLVGGYIQRVEIHA